MMAYGMSLGCCLLIFVCVFCRRSKVEAVAMKLDCPKYHEQDNTNLSAISVFNQTNFSSIRPCPKSLSLLNVSLEMLCLTGLESGCNTILRISWNFETKDSEDLLLEASLKILQFSPSSGWTRTVVCDVIDYDDDDDDHHHHSSSEVFSISLRVDYDCCDVDLLQHEYFAILKALYDDAGSCSIGASMKLMPMGMKSDENEAIASPVEIFPEREDLHNDTLAAVPRGGSKAFSFLQAAIVVGFLGVCVVIVFIVAYICIRRRCESVRPSFKAERLSSEPLALDSRVEDGDSGLISHQHNCPQCINERMAALFSDMEFYGSHTEECTDWSDEVQFDSGCHSGGSIFDP